MKNFFSFLIVFLFAHFLSYGTETRAVPTLVLNLHAHVKNLDQKLESPESPCLTDHECDESLWSAAVSELTSEVEQHWLKDAYEDYTLGLNSENNEDFYSARKLFYNAYLILKALSDDKEGEAHESLDLLIEETAAKISEENHPLLVQVLEDEQFQNQTLLHIIQQASGLKKTKKKDGPKSKTDYNDFERNPLIPSKIRKKVRPFLMPYNHPLRPVLDGIFKANRVILNLQTFADAGFTRLASKSPHYIVTAHHPALKGYLIKAFLDDQLKTKMDVPAWKWLVRRCQGVHKVRKAIKKNKVRHFVAPRKWIYPLPPNPAPPIDPAYARKDFVLIVEDMDLVTAPENGYAWRYLVTKEILREFYTVITEAGGHSYRSDNVAYTRSGKFAFIDTEYPKTRPNYRDIVKDLSPEMKAYWDTLVK